MEAIHPPPLLLDLKSIGFTIAEDVGLRADAEWMKNYQCSIVLQMLICKIKDGLQPFLGILIPVRNCSRRDRDARNGQSFRHVHYHKVHTGLLVKGTLVTTISVGDVLHIYKQEIQV